MRNSGPITADSERHAILLLILPVAQLFPEPNGNELENNPGLMVSGSSLINPSLANKSSISDNEKIKWYSASALSLI